MKKGGVQQLQADLQNDEDFEKFIDRPGLLVLDVYSEWCGPCLGMVGSLRKIKLEMGGDSLHLAICKSDYITALRRFQRKSEPTWLFVKNGKAVNIMFGTNVPNLTKMIITELYHLEHPPHPPHPTYDISELQPEEVRLKKIREDAAAEAIRLEMAENTKKRQDYLTHVTDVIMENLPDIGVTVFGPQVNRDMFKKIMEPADVLKIQCKDRKVVVINKADFETVNFACTNPIDPFVLDQLDGRELMLCFWKMPDDNRAPKAEILDLYAKALTQPRRDPNAEMGGEESMLPPIVTPMEVIIEMELQEGEEYEEEEEEAPLPPRVSKRDLQSGELDEDLDEDLEGEEEEGEDVGEGEPVEEPGLDFAFELEKDLEKEDDEEEVKEDEEIVAESEPMRRVRKVKVLLPPIWVANNNRTHAALIYVYFRTQTIAFLEPDPVPEPPCVIMAFDAYKKKYLVGLAHRHKEEIPLFGFFTSDNADEAEYITNSPQKYAAHSHAATDKMILKVSRKTSQIMLSLATFGPSYVSPNTVVGAEEALKFFPETYKTADQEKLEQEMLAKEQGTKDKKKKRSKGSHKGSEASSGSLARNTVETESTTEDISGAEPTEGAVTTSGDDSGDSMPHTVDAEGQEIPPETQADQTEQAAPVAESAAQPEQAEMPATTTEQAAPAKQAPPETEGE